MTDLINRAILIGQDEIEVLYGAFKTSVIPKKREWAGDRLLRSQLRLIYKKAHRYAYSHDPIFPDLVSTGCASFWNMLPRYNPELAPLTHYCALGIERDIHRAAHRHRNLIHIPRNKYECRWAIQKVKNNNPDATTTEICEKTGLSPKQVRDTEQTFMFPLAPLSLDKKYPTGNPDNSSLQDYLGVPDSRNRQDEIFEILIELVNLLPESYRDIVYDRHILGLSYEEIARKYKLKNKTCARMRLFRGLEKLTKEVKDRGLVLELDPV